MIIINEDIVNNNNINKINDPQLEKNKSFIINSVCNTYTTITDYICNFLGIMTFSKISYNTQISSKITSLFLNTKINIYVYDSKIANAFTVPGVPEYNPIALKSIEIFQRIPLLNNIINVIILLLQSWSIMNNIKKNETNNINGFSDILKYDENSGKLISGITEATCYISSGLINLLDTDDEIIAILLHEVGHNTMVFLNIFNNLAEGYLGGYTISEIISYIKNNEEYIDGIKNNNTNIWITVLKLILLGMVVTYFIRYLRRRQEIYSDEFAIKCGYGEAMESAIKKMHKFIKSNSLYEKVKDSLSFNFFDKILHGLNMLMFKIYDYTVNFFNFGEYPQSNRREKMIHDKTQEFDSSAQNLDRTKHIRVAL